jgi:hypothetical protein
LGIDHSVTDSSTHLDLGTDSDLSIDSVTDSSIPLDLDTDADDDRIDLGIDSGTDSGTDIDIGTGIDDPVGRTLELGLTFNFASDAFQVWPEELSNSNSPTFIALASDVEHMVSDGRVNVPN